jgi:hypothetical protein
MKLGTELTEKADTCWNIEEVIKYVIEFEGPK